MRPALWKAGVAGLVLFILGVAAGVAAIDMLEEDGVALARAVDLPVSQHL